MIASAPVLPTAMENAPVGNGIGSSTMPLQSLSLLNSDFAVLRARGLAERLKREATEEPQRTALAYRMLFCREPTPEETTATSAFLDNQTKEYGAQRAELDPRDRAWQDLCQALLSSNEFLYVE